MAHALVISPRAMRQLEKAVQWYESRQTGLGVQLRDEFEKVLTTILDNPFAYRKKSRLFRSARLHKFDSYAIYFEVNGETVSVYSFFHASRNPRSL